MFSRQYLSLSTLKKHEGSRSKMKSDVYTNVTVFISFHPHGRLFGVLELISQKLFFWMGLFRGEGAYSKVGAYNEVCKS